MKSFIEVVKFDAKDVITTVSGTCRIPTQPVDVCDPEAE